MPFFIQIILIPSSPVTIFSVCIYCSLYILMKSDVPERCPRSTRRMLSAGPQRQRAPHYSSLWTAIVQGPIGARGSTVPLLWGYVPRLRLGNHQPSPPSKSTLTARSVVAGDPTPAPRLANPRRPCLVKSHTPTLTRALSFPRAACFVPRHVARRKG